MSEKKKVQSNNKSDLNNILQNIDMNQIMSIFNSLNTNPTTDLEVKKDTVQKKNKEIELLKALKPLMNDERGHIIDAIIQFYAISKILSNK